MKLTHRMLKALALVGVAALPLGTGANAQDSQILPGGNWGSMLTETDGGHLFGNPDAETRLVEFMSYTCSHCAEFARNGEGAIKIAYVPTGRISYEIRHLIRDPIDLTAVTLTHCGDPAKFGGNHEAIMARFDEWMAKARSSTQAQVARWQFGALPARLKAIASDLGFYDIMVGRGYSRSKLDQCLSDEAWVKAAAETSAADIEKYDLKGTPSFVLNGKLLTDAYNWQTLEPHLDGAL